jgi:uncharacterized protein YndB with AHSA1/START domain
MNQMVQAKKRDGGQVIDAEARSAAPPERVWDLLTTTSSWTTWSKASEAELTKPGVGDAEGVGALRRFRVGRTISRERVVAFEPVSKFGYELLEGLPLRDYRAEVTLTPDGAGTLIRWHSSFDPKVRGTGWLYRAILAYFIKKTANLLARGAERPTA